MDGMSDDANVQGPSLEESVQQMLRNRKKDPGVPDGFKSETDFLRWATNLYDADVDADRENRKQAIEDMKFMVGEQWEDYVLTQRAQARKPTLTLNRLPAFVGQIVGNRKMNQTEIKVIADDAAHEESARIRTGLIRSIQKLSKAENVYDKSLENQVIAGIGNFKVDLHYAYDDVFEQDIRLYSLPNPLGVVWDRMSYENTGDDAGHCFIVDTMTRDEFKLQYPKARGAGTIADVRSYLTGAGISGGWYENDTYRVLEFWRMKSRKRIVALLTSETGEGEEVEDVTDRDPEEWLERLVTDGSGAPIMRETDRHYAEMYLMTATDILEGPYELPIKRVPVFRVNGWEVNLGDKRIRFGLIRFLKDPQRLHNYWRSIIAEKLMSTPKGNWIATAEAVDGREKVWRDSHVSDDTLLIWNGEAGIKPERVPPAQLEPALIEQAGMAGQDLFDISNMHQASLGAPGNEVSGRAITARQRMGEMGSAIYESNLQDAIEAAGDVINQLIPTAYDTQRVIKVLGEDGTELSPVKINDETDQDSVDITLGKYSVTSTTGPTYATKRQEAVDMMMNMVNAAPDTLGVALDLIIEAQDWPGAQKIARRIRTQLDPTTLPADQLTEEERQSVAGRQQQAEAEAQMVQAEREALLNERRARATESEARAQQAVALAAKAFSEVGVKAAELLEKTEDDAVKQFLESVKTFQEVTTPQQQ